MNKELISVICPAWNCGEYLSSLIESMREQEGVEWEMIVVDVGSTDGTQRIIEAVADERIKHVRADRQYNANIGRNIALCCSQGDFIFIADADSVLRKECLAKLKAKIDEGFDFAYCNFNVIWEMGKYIRTGVHICGRWDEERIKTSNYISVMSLWRREKLGTFDSKLERMQDWDMYLDAVERGLKAGYVGEKLFTVFMREEGMSRKIDKKLWEEIVREKREV